MEAKNFLLPRLEGKRCILRPLKEEDAPALQKLANERDVWRNLTDQFPSPYSISDAVWFIGKNVDNPGHDLAITVNKKFVGCIGLVAQKDVQRHTFEIGYWIGRKYWGRGIASEAVKLVTEYAFLAGVHRIFGNVFAWNSSSSRVLEKNGFRQEAIHRKSAFKDGRFVDELVYACLRDDYLKTNLS